MTWIKINFAHFRHKKGCKYNYWLGTYFKIKFAKALHQTELNRKGSKDGIQGRSR